MNQQQFNAAVLAGLHLVNSDCLVPTRHARGVALLEELLIAIQQGKLGLAPAMHDTPPPASDQPEQGRD